MTGLLYPGALRGALESFCDRLQQRKDDRPQASLALDGIAADFEQGALRALEKLRRLERVLLASVPCDPFRLAQHAVVAAAHICTLTEAERRADLADAVGRRDVERCLEHRLAAPGASTELALLQAAEGFDVVDQCLANCLAVAEARALLNRFRRAFAEVREPWQTADFAGLRASLEGPVEPMFDPFWPAWAGAA